MHRCLFFTDQQGYGDSQTDRRERKGFHLL
jgi:hypothetical protein